MPQCARRQIGGGLVCWLSVGLWLLGPARPGAAQSGGVLLHASLDSPEAIASLGGVSTLLAMDFVPAQAGNGVAFSREGLDCQRDDRQVLVFPAVAGDRPHIDLARGEVEVWYRPDYAAGDADDTFHTLLAVSLDGYSAPSLTLGEGDRLSLALVMADYTAFTTSAGYHAPLWQAGEWTHLRAVWDTTRPDDALHLYVNGARVDEGGAPGGWELGDEAAIGNIFVGSGTPCGDFAAGGILDELIIRDAPGDLSPPPADSAPQATLAPDSPGPDDPGDDSVLNPGPPEVYEPADLPLQPVGGWFTDPVFGALLRRASDASTRGSFSTPIYSQLQAFSADDAYLLLIEEDGYVVRRMSDFSRVEGLESDQWNAPRWQPARLHTLVHFDGNDDTTVRLETTDVDSLTTEPVFTFPAQYEYVRVNPSFDELSRDGRWLAGALTRSDGMFVIFTLNLESLTLGVELPLAELYAGACAPDPEWGQVEPDWIGVSPLGGYLVVQWKRDGFARCSGLETFEIETGAFVGRVYEGHQHGDLGIDVDGSEFFMTSENGSPTDNNRPALSLRALPGTDTASPPRYLLVMDWADDGHISCQGPPGVCLITNGGWEDDGWRPLERELFLLTTQGKVRRLVHHRSSSCGYWVQPRATLARDGRYAVFASDWGRQTGEESCAGGNELGAGDAYVLDLGAG